MFTINPHCTKVYSANLQWKIVHQRCMLGLPYRKITGNLHVDHSTVCRTVQVFEEKGSVDENTSKKLDDLDEMSKRYLAIAAMCMDDVIDVQITTESVNGEKFCDFLERCLLPQLLPYNGVNARSVMILDNASIHHIESATRLFEETGALAIFLPSYSPDYMPIEQCFSKLRATCELMI